MIALESAVVHELVEAGCRPTSLRKHDLRDGFYVWYGASGRRYVVSVFAFDPCARDAGLPAFEAFVLIPVVRDGLRRRACAVVSVPCGASRHRAIRDAIANGADEWHLHLLGTSRRERDAIAADLRVGAGLGLALTA